MLKVNAIYALMKLPIVMNAMLITLKTDYYVIVVKMAFIQ